MKETLLRRRCICEQTPCLRPGTQPALSSPTPHGPKPSRAFPWAYTGRSLQVRLDIWEGVDLVPVCWGVLMKHPR